MKNIMISLAAKAAQPGLNQPAIKSLQIIVPDTSTITQFNNLCDGLFHLIFTNANENKELASLRDWLLPMLMNRQVSFAKEEEEIDKSNQDQSIILQ